MKISLILAHPDGESFNAALAQRCRQELSANGHTVFFHDLYAERFNPILPAAEIRREAELPPDLRVHCDEISAANGIIIVHPNWWGQPPAILKGWIDRVIRPGIAYEFNEGDSGEGVPKGLLRHPVKKLTYKFDRKNTKKLKAWLTTETDLADEPQVGSASPAGAG